ncbi:UDP-N-acetylmuramoyl-L-alanyl-D-glutamate--2,6-diaminopimelate ligase [Acidaminobacter hydrogenoformans]|nr:UDP-N-acetylmuramoyl-L-alanyl-D-glutamate--2,6-diaminopimelate ligase [Acidaminobacter hydrogenoformans]
MMLKCLLDGLPYQCLMGDLDTEIKDLKTDSRKLEEGDLFIALKGLTTDGHAYLDQAANRGAVAALVERPLENPGILGLSCVVLVEGLSDQLALIGSRFYQEPSNALNVIGITGTNGKTSVAQMLADALESQGKRIGVLGTIGNRIGDQFFETQNTTLEPVGLQRLFRQAVDHDVTHLVMEVSSHGLALGRVDFTHFRCAVFTNLTEDHLDFHGDMEAYFQAKATLFTLNEGAAVINASDPYGKRLIEQLRRTGRPVLTYGVTGDCDFRASQISWTQTGTVFTLTMPDGQLKVQVPGLGRIQVLNALAVFAALSALGFNKEAIAASAGSLKAVPGRMERIKGSWPFDVFVDFAHTPDALKNVLEIARELTRGKLIVVFGCGGDRDRGKRPVMGRLAAELADQVYLTSDNPRSEDPEAILKEILAGIPEYFMDKVTVEDDRHLSIFLAVEGLQPGDVLIIAGKGHETYQIIGTTKHHFDDREEAERALYFWKRLSQSRGMETQLG